MALNNYLFFIEIIVVFTSLYLCFLLFKKEGLIAWAGVAVIIANIQVVKSVEIFSIGATLGNAVYSSVFLATDALSELYGKDEAKKAVKFGFFMTVVFIIFMNLSLLFKPSAEDFAHPALKTIFSFMPRVLIASMCAYIASNFVDVNLYHFVKKKFPKLLWLRNNLATMTAQAVDSIIFVAIAFFGVFSSAMFVQILLTTYFFKFIAAILDTPFIYLVSLKKNI